MVENVTVPQSNLYLIIFTRFKMNKKCVKFPPVQCFLEGKTRSSAATYADDRDDFGFTPPSEGDPINHCTVVVAST